MISSHLPHQSINQTINQSINQSRLSVYFLEMRDVLSNCSAIVCFGGEHVVFSRSDLELFRVEARAKVCSSSVVGK